MKQLLIDEILQNVQKPSRYLGNELNAVHKDPATVSVRMALAFPDLYDLGLSNIGLMILYRVLNEVPDVWCERVYAPAVDMEAELRRRKLPLFTLESTTPLRDFDCVGFTLQYELCYTNIVNMMDMAGIPLFSCERGDADPIIVAGGPVAFNPEPITDLIDVIILGDGEEAVLQLAAALRASKGRPRQERLDRIEAEVAGVYIPARFPTVQLSNGDIIRDPERTPVKKAMIPDLNKVPFPTDYIVPYVEQVHDRVSLEVLRGCTQGCRFCQAGMIYRPVRERSLENIAELTKEAIRKSGYEEISLSSLSTCDYSRVKALVEQQVRIAGPKGVSVGLPSLRMDSFSVDLAEMISGVKKTGLTFAPEAASDRLRAVIDKWIPDEELFNTTEEVYKRGWESVKLYFMIGLPTETMADVERIATLSEEVVRRGRRANRRARVHTSVSTFVPKPHTPFQWERQVTMEEVKEKHARLKELIYPIKAIKLSLHDSPTSWLEGVLTRGDRRLGRTIVEAWKRGARFDGWTEHFNPTAWAGAFEATGIDPARVNRRRNLDEPLPWDHIDCLVTKEYQKKEWLKAVAAGLTTDCRTACHRCGVIDEYKQLCVNQIYTARAGKKIEKEWTMPPMSELTPPNPDAVHRLRFRFTKTGEIQFLSHLELQNALTRAFRRAELPVARSQGFNPHVKLGFATALPVGLESLGEYAELDFVAPLSAPAFLDQLRPVLPAGLEVLWAEEVAIGSKSMTKLIVATGYEVELPRGRVENGAGPIESMIEAFLAASEIVVERKTKDGTRAVNVRRPVLSMTFHPEGPDAGLLRFVLREGNESARAKDVVRGLLHLDETAVHRRKLRKLDSFAGDGENLVSLSALAPAPPVPTRSAP
jgi:radical SAM family uncharacterized protein/radical SAM-linked protein